MIKKTLYFGNPAYLSLRNKQMIFCDPTVEKSNIPNSMKASAERTFPIEDLGVLILDHRQITITQGLLSALLENNTAVITCNEQRMPVGLQLPLEGNNIHNERFRNQIEASLPLKKQLWQQTIRAKIENQATCIAKNSQTYHKALILMAEKVRSGDPDNYEAQAAVYYWKNLFEDYPNFTRSRKGDYPNALLNYGYAILRAVIARALVGSGLLPVYGIHHHNRYNAFCLADDVMEPYRPFVDHLVCSIARKYPQATELTTDIKRELLNIPVLDVQLNGRASPLMIAASLTTSSLAKCFNGELRKINYPQFYD